MKKKMNWLGYMLKRNGNSIAKQAAHWSLQEMMMMTLT